MPPTTGRIVVAGHEVTGMIAERTAARRAIGYLPQEVTFPRGMTAFAFVDYIAVLKEWDDRRARQAAVDRLLDVVGLGDRRTARFERSRAAGAAGSPWPGRWSASLA